MSVPNEHVYERLVIRDTAYLETVEAATMKVALEVLAEPPETHGHDNRYAVALALFLSTEEAARFARAFAWRALFDPAIRGQVFHGPDDIRPEAIDGETLRTLIRDAWNVVSNVQPESEQEE